MVIDLLNSLTRLPTPAVLAITALLAFSETGIGFGFVVPGETGVLVMATTATTAPTFLALSVVVWLSASAGDSFGYLVGRRYGARLRGTRMVRRLGQDKWDRTSRLLHGYGIRTVVTSRFLPAIRVLTPVAAGSMHFPYRRFLPASLAGALVWAVAHVAAGALAGASLRAVDEAIGFLSWILLVVVAAGLLGWWWRRHRRTAAPGGRGHGRPAEAPTDG